MPSRHDMARTQKRKLCCGYSHTVDDDRASLDITLTCGALRVRAPSNPFHCWLNTFYFGERIFFSFFPFFILCCAFVDVASSIGESTAMLMIILAVLLCWLWRRGENDSKRRHDAPMMVNHIGRRLHWNFFFSGAVRGLLCLVVFESTRVYCRSHRAVSNLSFKFPLVFISFLRSLCFSLCDWLDRVKATEFKVHAFCPFALYHESTPIRADCNKDASLEFHRLSF